MFYSNLIFILILTTYFYIQTRFLINIFEKKYISILSDYDFKKPQSFHNKSIVRLGGTLIYSSLILVTLYLYTFQNILFIEYISFCTLFFFLGLSDDMKTNISPKLRLLLMSSFLIFLVMFNEFYLTKSGLEFLNNLLDIDIFALCFTCLCFLFIINGSNLIDGFNGLLGIHSFIILVILCIINFLSNNIELAYFLFYSSVVILFFLKFNFPKAKVFLGDSGSYLVGALIAISTVKTSILNPSITPFFFTILLFYLFFEVFFSFFRKIFVAKQSPLLPDNKHLHMLFYKFLLKKKINKENSNYKVSIYFNAIYLIFITPGIIFMHEGLFCRYYFFLLPIVYLLFYKTLYKRVE